MTGKEFVELLRRAGVLPTRVLVEPPVQPEDLVVIEYPGLLTPAAAAAVKQTTERALGRGRRVLVLDDGLRLRVERHVAYVEGLPSRIRMQ